MGVRAFNLSTDECKVDVVRPPQLDAGNWSFSATLVPRATGPMMFVWEVDCTCNYIPFQVTHADLKVSSGRRIITGSAHLRASPLEAFQDSTYQQPVLKGHLPPNSPSYYFQVKAFDDVPIAMRSCVARPAGTKRGESDQWFLKNY